MCKQKYWQPGSWLRQWLCRALIVHLPITTTNISYTKTRSQSELSDMHRKSGIVNKFQDQKNSDLGWSTKRCINQTCEIKALPPWTARVPSQFKKWASEPAKTWPSPWVTEEAPATPAAAPPTSAASMAAEAAEAAEEPGFAQEAATICATPMLLQLRRFLTLSWRTKLGGKRKMREDRPWPGQIESVGRNRAAPGASGRGQLAKVASERESKGRGKDLAAAPEAEAAEQAAAAMIGEYKRKWALLGDGSRWEVGRRWRGIYGKPRGKVLGFEHG